MRRWLKNRCGLASLEATRGSSVRKPGRGQVEKIQVAEADGAGFGTRSTPIILSSPGQSRQAGAAIATKGNRSECDLRHSVHTQAAYRAALRLASLPEDAMDLSTKLKITAVMAAVLVAVVWAVPVPV